MIQTLRRGEVPMFEAMFAQMAELRRWSSACSMSRRQRPPAIARALRLTREEFATIYLLTRRARPGSAGGAVDLGRALGFYDKVARDTAKKVLERWRRDPKYLFAIKTIEQDGSRPGRGDRIFGQMSDGDGAE